MKAILTAALAMLLMSGCTSCQEDQVALGTPANSDVAGTDGAALEVLDADADAALPESVLPADATDDAADSVEIADSASDVADAGLPGSTCTVEPLVDPVELGQPCSPVGAMRCSDLGAQDWNGYETAGGAALRCRRPHALSCQKSNANIAVWTLRTCNSILDETTQSAWQTCAWSSECEELLPGLARCTATNLKGIYGPIVACPPGNVGKKKCQLAAIAECSKVQANKVVQTGKDLQDYSLQPLNCASVVEGKSYWFPIDDCNMYQLANCEKPVPSYVAPLCSLKPDGESRCDKSCSEYWISKYNQPWAP